MLHRHLSGMLALAFLVGACSDNPVAVEEEEHDDALTAELTLSSDHVHILSELTFSVVVRDHHGAAVTDLDAVTVDRLAAGTDTWRSTELALQGTTWMAPYTFMSSGDYQLRVSVTRPGATASEVVYTMPEPVSAARAHVEVAGYRVEFETFPGHLHEQDQAEMKFWVMETERNADGIRPPIPGLDLSITCLESTGTTENHGAMEAEPGVYMGTHTFMAAGDFIGTLHLPGGEASFTTHVAHKH